MSVHNLRCIPGCGERQQEVIKLNNKTKTMVGIGLFTAIVVVLQLLGGGIKVGSLFSISLVLVPIVVGAAVYGWQAGAWLGFVFGVAVLLSGDAAAFMAIDVPGTIATVLVKGTACGLAAGLMYKLFSRKNRFLGVIMAAIICPITNTGVFLLGCKLFFYETVAAWGAAAGFANAAAYMFLGLAGINFLVELGTNIVLAPVITRLIKIGQK
ncbi:MAG: ECF transporter S component [Oscillospiraceae bacterium]|nr:ECF transporter S component [Oscillospiraceae bacterium]